MPDVHRFGEREAGERESDRNGSGLRADHDAPPATAVGYDSSQRRQEKDRNLARETHRAQQHRGAGKAVHQPRLGNVLHPGADEGNQLPAEEKLEISVPEGAQRRREFHSAFIVMWEAGAAWWDRRSVSVVCQAPCLASDDRPQKAMVCPTLSPPPRK